MDEAGLRAVVEPGLQAMGLELEAVELTPAGRRTIVRIVVDGDGPDGRGPSVDDIAEGTRAVSQALDQAESAGAKITGHGSYTLEVSSRGISRPLTTPAHWRRNRGRLVAVTDTTGDAVHGRIMASDEHQVTLQVEQPKQPPRTHTVAFAEIAKAIVQVELNRKVDEADTAIDEENGAR